MSITTAVAGVIATARACRPAWEAAQYGDRDPQVLQLAAIYERVFGDGA